MSEQFVEDAEPDEVFAALSNETRVAILQALWEAEGRAATFSELREAVGMADSGQFSYHLGKLSDRFVAKSGEEYHLTQAGKAINGAIASGAYTAATTIDPLELADPCRVCGETQIFRYEDEVVRIECDSCAATFEAAVPPAVFAGYDAESAPRVASRFLRTTSRHIVGGFCRICNGRVRPRVAPLGEIDSTAIPPEDAPATFVDRFRDVPWVQNDCQRCGASSVIGLDHALLDHPAVAGFYHDRGIDVRERLIWEFPPLDPDRLTVRSREPFRASATYRVEEDALTLVVDRELDVVDVET